MRPFVGAAVVDIGSPKKGSIGWAIEPLGVCGSNIDELVALLSEQSRKGALAIGFECPLWVPLRENIFDLTKQRIGENGRPWSAGAGASVLCTGLAVIPYFLGKLRSKVGNECQAFVDLEDDLSKTCSFFFFEAFVSGNDHQSTHEADARLAAKAFWEKRNLLANSRKIEPEPCLNLLGAMLLRTGWACTPDILTKDCFVLDNQHVNLGA